MLKQLVAGVVVTVAVMFAGAAMAGPLEDGEAAMNSGNYATGLTLLRPLAEQGNARAQGLLGAAYDGGAGVKKDDAEAVKWWRLPRPSGWRGSGSRSQRSERQLPNATVTRQSPWCAARPLVRPPANWV